MSLRVVVVSLALLLLAPAAALGSVADEQRQGRDLVAQLQSGAKRCGDLSDDDFERVGEYVMGRALGSTSVHRAMNDRMRLMMGEQAEERMHQLIGQRYAGCYGSAKGARGMMGGRGMGSGMIGGYSGNGGWSALMRSGDYGWMMGGNWRTMSRQDWQRLQRQWLGSSATTGRDAGWSGWAIAAVALGSALLAGLAVLAVIRRPWRRKPAAPST